MTNKKTFSIKTLVWLLAIVVTSASVFWLFSQRQNIQDILDAKAFKPNAAVTELSANLVLTDLGKRIFYASSPSVQDRDAFNTNCVQSSHPDNGALLGCFVNERIFLFDIRDPRLNGIMEVTAGHELLHAAFERLGSMKQTQLEEDLLALYPELVETNNDLEKRMSVYSDLSDNRFANELHSVLGTEVADLPWWLEEHYATWFEDRSQIVDYHVSYNEIFVELQEQAEALAAELTQMNETIEAQITEYSARVEAFNSEWETFKSRNEAFEFSGRADEFDFLMAQFEERRSQLEQERVELDEQIAQYEAQREELNRLNHTSTQLKESMNSSLKSPDL